MSDIEFVDGLILKAPRDGAPEYVKAKGSIKRQELIDWLGKRSDEWVNFDVKVSQAGKWYAAVDNWKPEGKAERRPPHPDPTARDEQDFTTDDIPF